MIFKEDSNVVNRDWVNYNIHVVANSFITNEPQWKSTTATAWSTTTIQIFSCKVVYNVYHVTSSSIVPFVER